jgi:hypothetical protein
MAASKIEVMIKHAIRSSTMGDATPYSGDNARAIVARQPLDMLSTLWWTVVKPILNRLGLKVKLLLQRKT